MATSEPRPFDRPQFRQLLALLFGLWSGMVVLVILAEGLNWLPIGFSDPLATLVFYLLLFGSGSLWVIHQYRQQGIDLRSLWGPWPFPLPWRAILGLWVTLFVFSLGAFQVSYTLISLMFPEQVQAVLQQTLFLGADETHLPWLYNTLLLGILIIGAPVLEEFLFRGFLLHRWGTRWNVTIAVVLSSVLFGLLHSNVVGLSAFGLAMALLYLRSSSLGLID